MPQDSENAQESAQLDAKRSSEERSFQGELACAPLSFGEVDLKATQLCGRRLTKIYLAGE
jgi:hypothetical protein